MLDIEHVRQALVSTEAFMRINDALYAAFDRISVHSDGGKVVIEFSYRGERVAHHTTKSCDVREGDSVIVEIPEHPAFFPVMLEHAK